MEEMCCWNFRPFNMVEQPEFFNYIKAIKPNIAMPSATILSRFGLEDVYSNYKKAIQDFFKKSIVPTILL